MSDELIRATKAEDLTALAQLLDSGLNVNERTRDGWTALDVAVRWNKIKSVTFLLQHGASVDANGDGGSRVMALADGKPIAHLLFRHGASGQSGTKWLLRPEEDTSNIPRDELPKTPVTSEDIYAVLGTLFRSNMFIWSGARIEHQTTTSISFSDEPITDDDDGLTYYVRYPWRQYWKRSLGLIEDFVQANTQSIQLARHLYLPEHIQFDNEEAVEGDAAARPAPFQLSCPGFNNDVTLALLYVQWYGGPLAASGDLTLFDKSSGAWQLAQHMPLWCA